MLRRTKEVDSQRAVELFNELFAELGQLPGVERVAGVMGLPTGTYGSNGYYETRGGLPVDADHPAWSYFSVASPGYFGAMGIPLKRGRDFGSEDTHESGMVAVISESLARQSFGDADPVGKQIRCGLDSDKWMTVVGVVGDVRQDSPAEKPGATLYMPMTQHPFYANQIHVVLRTAVKPLSLMSAVDEQDCTGGSADCAALHDDGCDGGQVDGDGAVSRGADLVVCGGGAAAGDAGGVRDGGVLRGAAEV